MACWRGSKVRLDTGACVEGSCTLTAPAQFPVGWLETNAKREPWIGLIVWFWIDMMNVKGGWPGTRTIPLGLPMFWMTTCPTANWPDQVSINLLTVCCARRMARTFPEAIDGCKPGGLSSSGT